MAPAWPTSPDDVLVDLTAPQPALKSQDPATTVAVVDTQDRKALRMESPRGSKPAEAIQKVIGGNVLRVAEEVLKC
jgi:hypothetical protein